MCATAAKMLASVKTCKLYDRARLTFERHARASDCEAMWDYFSRCLRNWPQVDPEMQRQGLKPLASVRNEMAALYQEHRSNIGTRASR